MPTAKKPPARKPAARGAPRSSASKSTATRREVERPIARFEKLLDDAGDALQSLSKDMGRGAQDAYKELTKTMKALRRDAAKTNRDLLKDFDKLRAAVTPSGTTQRASTRTTARSGGTRTAARSSRSTSAARSGGSRSTAKRTTRSGAEQVAIHDDSRSLEQNSHIPPPPQRLPGALTKRGDAHRIVTAPASLAASPRLLPANPHRAARLLHPSAPASVQAPTSLAHQQVRSSANASAQ